jgi:hypothetical protein
VGFLYHDNFVAFHFRAAFFPAGRSNLFTPNLPVRRLLRGIRSTLRMSLFNEFRLWACVF